MPLTCRWRSRPQHRKRTLVERVGMSALCRKRKSSVAVAEAVIRSVKLIVEALIRQPSGGLQCRRDDRAWCDARRCARSRRGNFRNRQACGSERCRDDNVWIERIIDLSLLILG